MALVFGIFFFLLEPDYGYTLDFADWNLTLSLLAVLACYYLGNRIFRHRMEQASALPEEIRWETYRTSVIIQLALLEMAILITLILFLVQANTALLVTFIFGVVLFVQCRPTEERFRSS
jgi:hypothetical protein